MAEEKRMIEYEAVYQYAFRGVHGGNLEDEDFDAIINAIDSVPSVDAIPVVHAQWAKPSEYGMGHKFNNLGLVCSACVSWIHSPHNYCPNCGAKMDGVAE